MLRARAGIGSTKLAGGQKDGLLLRLAEDWRLLGYRKAAAARTGEHTVDGQKM